MTKARTARKGLSKEAWVYLGTATVAVAGILVAALPPIIDGCGDDDPADAIRDDAPSSPGDPAAPREPEPPRFVDLLWAPARCDEATVGIGYGDCNEVRPMAWLAGELRALRADGVRGFVALPASFELVTEPHGNRANWILAVKHGSELLYRLTVGWEPVRAAPEHPGGIRLYEIDGRTLLSPAVYVDEDGQWWEQEGPRAPTRVRPRDPT